MNSSGQMALDGFPPTSGAGPSTSFAAAERVAPSTEALRERIVEILGRLGRHGATCHELCLMLNMDIQTGSPRCNELMNAGRIVRDGRTRKTSSGAPAMVWTLKTEE